MKGVIINGSWSEDPECIKKAAVSHFSSRFKESVKQRPTFISDKFQKLCNEDADMLIAPFSIEEIKAAVWSCDGMKAPGPDGLNFEFVKKHWDIMQESVVEALRHFEKTGFIARGCNASFISLVPKTQDPLELSDFRPISLLGCVYKILAKMLASRMVKVMDKLISHYQSAFISGRQILDGILIANEVVNYAKKANLKLLLFKVDFEKAFDSVNWIFLMSIMCQMGFPEKWRTWIRGCLQSASVSVLINGSPSSEFSMERGLRQGDPLSPFLFLIAGEALQVMAMEACDKGLFKGLRLSDRDVNLAFLQFADDALFLGRWSKRNVTNLSRILQCFHEISGLKVNMRKSRLLGIGIDDNSVNEMARAVRCQAEFLPFTYLGLPVGAKMTRAGAWNGVIERCYKKLNNWKAKSLSIGGRYTLINSVLTSMPLYFFSVFKAPAGVLKRLECIRRRFFWGHKDGENGVNWVAWDKVIKAKQSGGLGIKSLKIQNLALLSKWHWRYYTEENSLWKWVIDAIHGLDGGRSNWLMGSTWSAILKVNDEIEQVGVGLKLAISKSLAAGSNTKFWYEKILDNGTSLKDAFPRLFALESCKDVCFNDRWVLDSNVWRGVWMWRSTLRGRALTDLALLEQTLREKNFAKSGGDRVLWREDPSGSFSVKRMSAILHAKLSEAEGVNLKKVWCSFVPIKINIFIWRLLANALPTRSNLQKRGILVDSINCVLCDNYVEDVEHCLCNCPMVSSLWRKISSWLGCIGSAFKSLDLLLSMRFLSESKKIGRKL